MRNIQLFCIPYAGGNASFFRNLKTILGDTMDVYPLEYAGHGLRYKEPFYENIQAMVQDIAMQIKEKRDPSLPYAVFGYSMGSMVAYEAVTMYFAQDMPAHVFLAAHLPPHLPFQGKVFASSLDDDAFLAVMERFGGIDSRLKNNRRFLDIFLPCLRADYQFLMEYRWESRHGKLPCDITVFYAEEDTDRKSIAQWRDHTMGEIRLEHFDGGHFFLKGNETKIAEIILEQFTK